MTWHSTKNLHQNADFFCIFQNLLLPLHPQNITAGIGIVKSGDITRYKQRKALRYKILK